MKYYFVLLLSVIGSAVNAASALPLHYNGPGSRAVADTDSAIRKRSISVGINYGNDVWFYGRTSPIRYPFMGTDVIYNSKSGVFVYASAMKVLGYDPLVDEIDLGAGYFYKYSKKATGTLSYSRFFFNKDAANVIKSASSNDINFKNSYDWKIAKSSITTDYLFGKSSDFLVTFNISKYIETSWSIFDDQDYLSFNPSVSAIFGTQNFVHKYSLDHPNKLELYDIDHAPEGSPQNPYNNGRFNSLNYSVKIPIAYNRPHYTLEASWKYSIPVNVEGELKNKHEVFFNMTFYYLFY
ncbi:hypothetical protein KXD93_07720 [Mucilaginibacter sp. BJC16-A38]|uniref:hypothetical protein n=1 Tax=Mucilaginibacter phenanthrenivorans TaxID=1234842 RepID=UPI0021581F20|nr:hypothetical protein [Mucilaginibacter phenanthrenivorans]MCR8557524.1 hypothetical protein [Mucilaginibacter phenanthrenivorans]